MNSRLANLSDINGILSLQKANLYSELAPQERVKGFVTTPFTIPQMEEIMASNGLFVMENKNKIIAYAFAGTWHYFEQWAIFPYMTSRFPLLHFKDWEITTENSFQYGPVCIALEERGKGLINILFEAMRIEWLKRYLLSITFINQVNDISLQAHKKLGWTVIDSFEFNNNQYWGLAFEMQNSVLNK